MITHTTSEQGDDIAAEYDAHVNSQRAALTVAVTDARDAVRRASHALLELIELDAPGLAAVDADDAMHALMDAGHAIRAADRCNRTDSDA